MLSSRGGHNDRVSIIQDDALLWDMLMDGLLNGSDGISPSEAMDSMLNIGDGSSASVQWSPCPSDLTLVESQQRLLGYDGAGTLPEPVGSKEGGAVVQPLQAC